MQNIANLASISSLNRSGRVASVGASNGLLNNLYSFWLLDSDATDEQGTRDGTASNITWNTSDYKWGTASAQFNGSSSSIDMNDGDALMSNLSSLSVGGWIKILGTGNLLGTDGITPLISDGWVEVGFAESTGYAKVQIYDGSTSEVLNGTTNIDDGGRHHLMFTLSSSGRKLYVDGTLEDSNATSHSTGNRNADTLLGRRQAATNFRWLNGLCDEVGVWHTELTGTDVTTLQTTPYSSFTS